MIHITRKGRFKFKIALLIGVDETQNWAVDDILRYQKTIYDIAPRFDRVPQAGERERIRFEFDIHRWLQDKFLKLSQCRYDTHYDIWFSADQIGKMRHVMASAHDSSQTRQFVLRDLQHHAFIPVIEPVLK